MLLCIGESRLGSDGGTDCIRREVPATLLIIGPISDIVANGIAVGLENNAGVEMLIHIGLDTVKLNGKHFSAKVKSGDMILEIM